MKEHRYEVATTWTSAEGTRSYTAYSRAHEISAPGKSSVIQASSDPTFRGDRARYNPEELLVASISSCHMLWFLHLAAHAGIVVMSYECVAEGTMVENADGSGEFSRVVLRPKIAITDPSRMDDANKLHPKAHAMCFIARSVRFPIEVLF